jgi:hypothetical protein
MNNLLKTITITTILFGASNAMSYQDYDVDFSDEANSCIQAVNERANYENASRVAHDVNELKNTFTGYVLSVDTRVFDEDGENILRQYSSHCVAKGKDKPRRIKVTRLGQ